MLVDFKSDLITGMSHIDKRLIGILIDYHFITTNQMIEIAIESGQRKPLEAAIKKKFS